MPFFENIENHPLDFEINNERYLVPVGAVVEIDKSYAYVIPRRGLPLKQIAPKDVGDRKVTEARKIRTNAAPLPKGVVVGKAPESDDEVEIEEGDSESVDDEVEKVAARVKSNGK